LSFHLILRDFPAKYAATCAKSLRNFDKIARKSAYVFADWKIVATFASHYKNVPNQRKLIL